MVRNGKETDSFLKKESASLFYKDLKKYTEDQKKVIEFALVQSTKFGLKSIMKQWLTKNIIDFDVSALRVKEDYLSVLISFQSNETDLKKIFDFQSINEVIRYIELNYGSEKKIVPLSEMNIFFELDGRFISMPMTERASIFLGKDTVWCTAYTASDNLFISYVTDNTILFYIISTKANPRKNPEDKICVGYKEGKIIYGGSQTVDSANNEISKERLDQILGKNVEKFKTAMSTMVSKYKKMHPIQLRAIELGKSARKFSKKVDEVGIKETMKLIGRNAISTSVFEVFLDRLFREPKPDEVIEYIREEIGLKELFSHTADEFVRIIFVNPILSGRHVSQCKTSIMGKLIGECNIKEDTQEILADILIKETSSTLNKNTEALYQALVLFFYNENNSEKIKLGLLNSSVLTDSGKDVLIGNMLANYELRINSEIFDAIFYFDFISGYRRERIIKTCNLKKNTMNKIISSGIMRDIEYLAENNKIAIHTDIVERLFTFPESVRESLALNIALKNEFQIRLLHDKSTAVALKKAENIRSPELLKYFIIRKELVMNCQMLAAYFKYSYSDTYFSHEEFSKLLENRRYLLFIAEYYSFLFNRMVIEEGLIIDSFTHKKPAILEYILDEEVIEKIVANKNSKLDFVAYYLATNEYYLQYFIRLLNSKQVDKVIETVIKLGTEKQIKMCIDRHDKPRKLLLGLNEVHYYSLLERFPDMKEYLDDAVL